MERPDRQLHYYQDRHGTNVPGFVSGFQLPGSFYTYSHRHVYRCMFTSSNELNPQYSFPARQNGTKGIWLFWHSLTRRQLVCYTIYVQRLETPLAVPTRIWWNIKHHTNNYITTWYQKKKKKKVQCYTIEAHHHRWWQYYARIRSKHCTDFAFLLSIVLMEIVFFETVCCTVCCEVLFKVMPNKWHRYPAGNLTGHSLLCVAVTVVIISFPKGNEL